MPRQRTRLHRKLANSVFWATLLFALLTSVVCFAIVVNRTHNHVEITANQLLDTVEKTATVAVYAENETIAGDVVDGLMRHDIIRGVRLDSARNLHMVRNREGDAPLDMIVARELHSPFGEAQVVGSVSVVLDPYVILREAGLQAALYALNSFVLIGLTAWLVLRLVRTSLSNPLAEISEGVVAITEGRQQRLERRTGDGPGEFNDLIDYINSLLTALDDKFKAEHALNTALTLSKSETDRISRAKSDFLAYLSHELRHPMNVITIASQLAMADDMPASQREYLHGIQIATRSMLSIINEVLDFSKIESGKHELEYIPFQLDSVMYIVRQLHTMQATANGIALDISLDPKIPPRLIGDPVRLGQILTNFVSNALKFTRRGTIRVVARQTGLTERVSTIRFAVADTGIGLREDQCQRLFEPYGQLGLTLDQNPDGAGLGLVISRQLVRMMGGDISVHSVHNRGSEFSFTIQLPIARDATDAAGPDEPQVRKIAHRNLSRLLLVDDSEINLLLEAKLLTVNGFQVDTANSGAEAVAKVRENGRAYCAILMDLRMPEMDGYATTREIREQYGSDELPIIAVTANAFSVERENCLAAGFNEFLTKPLEIGELLRTLERVALGGEA